LCPQANESIHLRVGIEGISGLRDEYIVSEITVFILTSDDEEKMKKIALLTFHDDEQILVEDIPS